MKLIMAIIRIDRMNETKRALAAIGVDSMTATGKALGRGSGYPIPGGNNTFQPRLRPQRVLNIAVPDNQVAAIVRTLIRVNQTPAAGDGKIFVLPLHESVRVRTGETGESIL